ncbi:tyrosine-type recombinase/integrase [Micromonospora sp. NPDC048930]|uniref:tyrosine-type recombinase/integrase n=1 Tax=Micromonospora sp. NPDC048930 TaxID=3364261 RepID=UPI003719E6DB
MTGPLPNGLTNQEVAALRSILARIPDEGLRGPSAIGEPPGIPTFRDYIQRVLVAVSPGSRRLYESYWKRIEQCWGERKLNDPTPSEISALVEQVRASALVRSNSRGGRSAAEHTVSALRCLYAFAVADGLIAEAEDPARRVAKPRRLPSNRHALPERQLARIVELAGRTGNDPHLDSLILRLHIETACRRGGALGLDRADLDLDNCCIRLSEKGGTVRWQPVSPSMLRMLVRHYEERGKIGGGTQLLRYRSGAPLTSRRYDHLWQRLGRRLPWVQAQQVSTHWLRHTTLTWVERNFGYAIARAYAGHSGRSDAGVTSTYVKADIYDVARALSSLSGEPHPLIAEEQAIPWPERMLAVPEGEDEIMAP